MLKREVLQIESRSPGKVGGCYSGNKKMFWCNAKQKGKYPVLNLLLICLFSDFLYVGCGLNHIDDGRLHRYI
ncbi:hypothetical protein BDZ94DRAFT_1262971 [Collybia nuda]|uniref:Uncharacterized protein n=1 Tax=Collybia nuda TaxID=64659 RepID=A0A9P5Y5Q5_9AGAR|nr:hypothetical protein BDZ94DRAFT_1262971 [Collybia nuda]